MSDRRLTKIELSGNKFKGVHRTIIVGLMVGAVFVLASFVLEQYKIDHNLSSMSFWYDLFYDTLRELGIVLISVWGITLFYEKYIADRHFTTFHSHLEQLIARGKRMPRFAKASGS